MGTAASDGVMLFVMGVVFLVFLKPPPHRPDRIIEEYDIKK